MNRSLFSTKASKQSLARRKGRRIWFLPHLALATLFLGTVPPVAAGGDLQSIMRGMGEAMGRVEQALWRSDFSATAEAAAAIENHPKPGMLQRLSLLGRLGGKADEFMAADEAMQEAASAVRAAAEVESLERAAASYRELHRRCMACHIEFQGAFSGEAAE